MLFYSHHTSSSFFWNISSINAGGRSFFFHFPVCFRLWPRNHFFLSFLLLFLSDFATLSRNGIDFVSLSLGFLRQEEFLEPWICIFKEVLWDGWWPLGQRASKSWTMMLDLRPILAFILTTLCTISWWLVVT